jgi:hypothetical protein
VFGETSIAGNALPGVARLLWCRDEKNQIPVPDRVLLSTAAEEGVWPGLDARRQPYGTPPATVDTVIVV